MSCAAFSINLSKPSPRKLSCRLRVIMPTRVSTSACAFDSMPDSPAEYANSCGMERSVSILCPDFVRLFKNLRQFLVESHRSKRLHHIAVRADLGRRNNIFLLGLGGHHQ